MTDEQKNVLDAYAQADASGRQQAFKEYVGVLKQILAAGATDVVARSARGAITLDLDYSAHVTMRSLLKKLRPNGGEPLRVAVLGGQTTTQLTWLIENFLFAQGLETAIWEGEYGLFRQSILGPDSSLDAFRPQIVFIATSARDVMEFPSLGVEESDISRLARSEYAKWESLWKSVHERWGAQVIQNLFDIPPWGSLGHLGTRTSGAREHYLARMNDEFAKHAPSHVVLHDLQQLALESGAKHWFDPRYYHEAKLPCGPECLVSYAHSVSSLVAAIKGKSRKVLVLDLDNTLWGGVIGDDGIAGIQVGQGSAEGESYVAFQQYAKSLAQRGILLAVCSKNEEEIAREPFQKIPDMALKLEDFSSFIANWENKADNLRRIAGDLNLGLDSFVFVDDNPAERALVRRFLPEVAVPDMPADPAEFISALARHRYFEVVSLTGEDLKRSTYYAQDRQRKELAAEHTDIESYLASLDMCALLRPIEDANIERSTQLINKSNQFNLTTKRYTLAEIKQKSESPQWLTLTTVLRDKLGDYGLISVVLAEIAGADLRIDTWVMSCRVLQRGVETLVMNALLDQAAERGCGRIVGRYIPTPRNHMVSEHYARLGFEKLGENGDGATEWSKRVTADGRVATHIRIA